MLSHLDTKLLITNIKNVDQSIISKYEINTLPAIFQLKNGIISHENSTYLESEVLKRNDGLIQNVDTLSSLINNINSDLNEILSELLGLIRNHSSLFSTRSELVQIAASAAVSFSDIPNLSIEQMHNLIKTGEKIQLNNEMNVLVDSIFNNDNFVEILNRTALLDKNNYSEPEYKARIYRSISSRYFREGNNKTSLDYAYRSLQLEIEYQSSLINSENVMKLDPYKIDLYSESAATIFIKHLIMAIGYSSEVLDIRSKIEFMFRNGKFIPLKFKPKSHPRGGPPVKGRGYRAKWLWHGLDYRPRKYKPRNIYKYHDEWRTVHDGPVLNY